MHFYLASVLPASKMMKFTSYLFQVFRRLFWNCKSVCIVADIFFVSKTVASKNRISFRSVSRFATGCLNSDFWDRSGDATKTRELRQRSWPVSTFWFFWNFNRRVVIRRNVVCRRMKRQLQICLRQSLKFFVTEEIDTVPMVETILRIFKFWFVGSSGKTDPSSRIKSAKSFIRHSAWIIVRGRSELSKDFGHFSKKKFQFSLKFVLVAFNIFTTSLRSTST